jgi:ribonuclease-3
MLLRLGKNPYRDLEKKLGYAFKRRALLETAFIHRSYRYEAKNVDDDNQRLEFLGDAVMGFVVAAHIYRTRLLADEGELTDMRSRVTSGRALAVFARDIGLGAYIKLGRGEEQSGGRLRESVLADCLEAVIGAAFIDGGTRAVEKIYTTLFAPVLGTHVEVHVENPKGALQEIVQRRLGHGPVYRSVREDGPAHDRQYTVEVVVGEAVMGVGTGRNRRVAEAAAALEAVEKLMKK